MKRLWAFIKRPFRAAWNFVLEIPLLYLLSVAWPLVGVLLIGYGAYQIYEPAGFIAVGLLMVLDSLHASSKPKAPK